MKKLIIILTVILILSACSNNKERGADEMKTFKQDSSKEVKIPKNPKRIVVLHPSYVGALVKFGHKPVGVTNYVKENKTLRKATEGAQYIDSCNIESITKLKPDLIITTREDKNYKKLQKISPTIQMDAMNSDFRKVTKKMAFIINEEEKANKWLKNWDNKMKEDRELLVSKISNKSITVLQATPKGISAFGKNYGRGTEIVYGGYNMKQPKQLEKDTQNAYMINMSLENLRKYTGDYIILATKGQEPAFTTTNNWKNLDAVKNRNVLKIDVTDTQYNDPISLEKQREELINQLKIK
ncbi:iron-siderophores ABC transporter periplasmic protein [Staphylococcus xylosus]|uniref:ABC transporter substrate-binding protein n=1 Tax=Staphylococcus xylosus TaxID=1288 RepID=UPI00085C32B5|nr:ABC transporter substrate-binding protein [Staphylococcus xylosus]SCU37076.1 iron-siderophores ABC transporter periplasmic protein [Staphylococcus xylosus]